MMQLDSPAYADTLDAFAAALLAASADEVAAVAHLSSQPGFKVYRNTVMKAAIDALQANYPAVLGIVGEEWFRAAAAIYVRAVPPRDPRLMFYGDEFSDFLEQFPPAQEMPYLAPVARLDRLWTEAHVAADAAPISAASVAALPPEALGALCLCPHPAARWYASAEHPIFSIWQHNRSQPDQPMPDIAWQGQAALISRPHDAVLSRQLPAAGCAFLDACAHGANLSEAVAATLAQDPDVPLQTLMANLLEAGALVPAAMPA